MKKLELLEQYFGHKEFRHLQEEAIDAILGSRDLLMILPTGGGKSLCYQLPSLMMSGVTVVVSPLLALMHDQVVALTSNGISAAMLSSMQTIEESKQIEQRLKKGMIKLLYVAPERLTNPYFISALHYININFFVIDEAHCVSEWGHEFRENYRQLSLLKEQFTTTPIAAFTATATSAVERDIATQLRLVEPMRLRGSIFRRNLTIRVEHRIKDGRLQLLEFLKSHKGDAGIIYSLSRKSTENIAHFLQGKGIAAQAYHAALATEKKNSIYSDFVSDRIEIVVATIAFGMGIDKSNIRFVVHMTMPKTLENFYQEIGRAGRDGLESESLLLPAAQDIVQQKSFIDDLPDTPYKRLAYSKIESIVRFTNTQECRHKSIAHYFDDAIENCQDKCDNCLNPDIKSIDITTASQKLLSAIYRTNQSFGLHYVVDVLRGSKEKRVLENNHNELSVYGIGEEYSKAQWLTIADRLLELGAVTIGDFKVYLLSAFGVGIIKGEHSVDLREDRLSIKKSTGKKIVDSYDEQYDIAIFEAFKARRSEIAQANNIPPYIVFSDKTLKELSAKLPKNEDEMLAIHGIGKVKFERYGEEFLELIRSQGEE